MGRGRDRETMGARGREGERKWRERAGERGGGTGREEGREREEEELWVQAEKGSGCRTAPPAPQGATPASAVITLKLVLRFQINI